ncbi:inositol monophosphatase family protein [Microbacterium sp. ZXX196]|uniref:inositol monophosphatase family protein n=1 Tax=Microbacterium sp. ZXX196 TaxID=2609291 RepID=UPI0012B73BA8|nr:inositol monophosphatase family protein [Microbacterium sp. ZXX196]MTE23502.1 inositol monophosphatase [Microbacterium sp. ZXX196]
MTRDENLRDLARDIALEAGALAERRRAEGVRVAASKTTLADIVTEADREVEALIRGRLAAERPDDGFLGEESGTAEGRSGVTWVVDPIDGTVNYASGMPSYGVSIAAVEGGDTLATWTALAGVVHHPALGETYTAARGSGSVCEAGERAQRIRVATEFPAGALVATGFGYDPRTHAGDIDTVRSVMPIARDVRRIGAASIDLSYVAAGRIDAYFERGLQPWDVAAGALLVVEAGGAIRELPADRFGRRMTVAGEIGLVERIADRISGVTSDE